VTSIWVPFENAATASRFGAKSRRPKVAGRSSGTKPRRQAQFLPTYNQVKELISVGKTVEAQKIVDGLSDEGSDLDLQVGAAVPPRHLEQIHPRIAAPRINSRL
jgi:hypothetical protein